MKRPPTRHEPAVVFLNAAAGTGRVESVAEQVRKHCEAEGRELRIVVTRDFQGLRESIDLAREAGAESVAVGGGDGTLSRAASLVLDSGLALGVLPLGTFNHFAKDAGIPLELAEAMSV